ncbi:hypothetical protein R1flu_018776 [Riccia fluitans]|uniref:CBS domain-containing protein n=1 Tax=Riccia fluitans TaxID=41844 RepID=A0ABD1ZGT8_9MARC
MATVSLSSASAIAASSSLPCSLRPPAAASGGRSSLIPAGVIRCSTARNETENSQKAQPMETMKKIACGLCAALTVATAMPSFAASSNQARLPPLSRDPERCQKAFVGNTIGQANGVADVLLDLRFCDYTNDQVNLKGKTLSAALMSDAKFDGADMTEVTMSKAYAVNASFKGTTFRNAVLDRVVFDGADLRGTQFINTVLSGSTFTGANLENASFEDALIGYVDIQKLCKNPTLSQDSKDTLGCSRAQTSSQALCTIIVNVAIIGRRRCSYYSPLATKVAKSVVVNWNIHTLLKVWEPPRKLGVVKKQGRGECDLQLVGTVGLCRMNGVGLRRMDLWASVSPRCAVYPARIGSAGDDHCSRLWLNKVQVSVDAPLRKSADNSGILLFVRAKSKAKKALQEALEREKAIHREQRELLAQVRSRKKLTWLQREQALSQGDSEVEKIWPFWRKKKKAELKARALTKRLIELSKKQQLDQVFKVLEEAKKEDCWIPSLIIMNAVVTACVNCRDIDRAFQVYQEMIGENGCGVDNVTYGTLLRGLGEARRLDDAFELVEKIVRGKAPGNPKLTDVHLNTLVNACVEAGDPLRARAALLRYRSSVPKTSPSTLTYNLLIKGCARSDNPLEALKLKEEMISQGLQPQRLTYNSLIFACVNGRDMNQGFELLKEMKSEARRLNTSRLLPDVVTYTTLLKGTDDIDSVLNLVEEMKRSPTCVMDRVAYTAIVDACISAGAVQEGLRFLEEMKELAKSDTQMRPKSHVFLALMRAYAENGDIEMVKNLKQQMVPLSAGNVSAEDRAQADELLIEAAVNLGQIGLARSMLRGMVGLKKGIPLTGRAHTVLVRLQALLGFQDSLFKPYVLQPGISPYEIVETIMIRYEDTNPLPADIEVKKVIMRFFKEDAIPVVDDRGACIGAIYSEDIREMDVRIRDVMRGPPPVVTSSTLIYRAVGLLLNPRVKLLAVVSSRAAYSTNKSSSIELPLGFIPRGTIFSWGQYQPVRETLRTPQVSNKSVKT